MILSLMGLALALPCADPFTADEFRTLVAQAEDALDNDDVMGHGQSWLRMKESMPCLVEPLPKDEWARYLIGHAIIRHATGQEWRAPLLTALSIDPDISRDYGHDDIRLFPVPPVEDTRGLRLAEGEAFLLDGLFISIAPPHLDGPHVIQMAGTPYKTRLLMDEEFPSNWLFQEPAQATTPQPEPEPTASAPPVKHKSEKEKRSKALLITGVGLGLVGGGGAIASFVTGTADDVDFKSPQQLNGLVWANTIGWGAAGVGGGLVVVHLARGPRVSVGPKHLGVQGRW